MHQVSIRAAVSRPPRMAAAPSSGWGDDSAVKPQLSPTLELVTTPVPRSVWRELLERDERALISQTPDWLDAACAVTGGDDASRLYQWSDGRSFVLPLVRRSVGRDSLVRLESMPPMWGPGGVVSAVAPLERDTNAIFEDLANLRLLRVGIRPAHSGDGAWGDAAPAGAIRNTHCRQVLDLRGGFSHVLATRFSASTRRNARKAESEHLTVESGSSTALVDAFYELYERWTEQRARDRGIPVWLAMRLARRREPRSKYEEVADRLGGACRIWVARYRGQAIAAAISLTHRSHAVYWRGASDRDAAGKTRANVLLQKLMIEEACAAGCVDFDMGESGGVTSLIEYKRRFGAEEVVYDEYRLERFPLTALESRASAMTGAVERTLQRIAAR